MKALRFRNFGAVAAVLQIEELPTPAPVAYIYVMEGVSVVVAGVISIVRTWRGTFHTITRGSVFLSDRNLIPDAIMRQCTVDEVFDKNLERLRTFVCTHIEGTHIEGTCQEEKRSYTKKAVLVS